MQNENNKPNVLQFTEQDVEVIDKEPLYKGFFEMNRYRLRHRLFEGGWSKPITREMFERGHAVAVLPYDPTTEEFVLIEQFRPGALGTGKTPWLLEVIAGMIGEQEDEQEVCIREAQEEANLHIYDLVKACTYLVSPGGTTERLSIFVARTDSTQASGVHGLDHESEDIQVHRVSERQARQWLDDNTIDNAAAIIALQWFFMHKENLLAQWS